MAEEKSIENPEASSDEINEFEQCDSCLISSKSSVAEKYCSECEEKLCEDCAGNHTKRKATSTHKLVLMKEIHPANDLLCSPCADTDKVYKAVTYCNTCEEYLCSACTHSHKIRKATKLHGPIEIGKLNQSTVPAEKRPACEPCGDNKIHSTATNYCKECEEYLCEMCRESHTFRRATKSHRPVHISSLEQSDSDANTEREKTSKLCDPCTFLDKREVAISFCSQCEELLCADCTNKHRTRKLTKSHVLGRPETAEIVMVECGLCGQTTDKRTVMYCNTCDEKLCERCAHKHQQKVIFKNHSLKMVDCKTQKQMATCDPCKATNEVKNAETFCKQCGLCGKTTDKRNVMYCNTCDKKLCERCAHKHQQKVIFENHSLKIVDCKTQKQMATCDPCKATNEVKNAETFCKQCEEHLCKLCARYHRVQKITKHHNLIDPHTQTASTTTVPLCDPCLENNTKVKATSHCLECDENFCDICRHRHKSLKITKHHEVVDIINVTPRRNIKVCGQCQEDGKSENAIRYCEDCREYFCAECCKVHKRFKVSKSHALHEIKEVEKASGQDYDPTKPEEQSLEASEIKDQFVKPVTQDKKDRPGKPNSLNVLLDTITMAWDPASIFDEKDHYQISYKDHYDNKWNILQEKFATATAEVKGLKSNTTYTFRVRVVSEDDEGQWSEESDKTITPESIASQIVQFAVKSKDGNPTPAVYALPMTEIYGARDEKAKIRTFEFGSAKSVQGGQSKTIIFVGGVGTGKSTMVDGIVNYVLGVNWDDPFRFTVRDISQSETDRQKKNEDWITTYTINPQKGSRLQYQLNIVDIPGFGDARGLENDQKIEKQISQLVSERLQVIDAVCLFVKAPNARLTSVQSYIYQSIMSLLGKDIEKNICTLVTFADCNEPPVVSALRQSGLPFGRYFTFNHSGLFANKFNGSFGSLSQYFWEMGVNSFPAFFVHMEQVGTQSIQLTEDVLSERYKLEKHLKILKPHLEAGRAKLEYLNHEANVLEKLKSEMRDNNNFEYEVEEMRHIKKELPKGLCAYTCVNYNVTCHEPCSDSEMNRRNVMSINRNCTACPDKCSWKLHVKTPYVFVYVTDKVKKTYKDMEMKYATQEECLRKLGEELDALVAETENIMVPIKECTKRLQEIALCPNPLTTAEFIDLLIETEKFEKKVGYLQRINQLNEFRKRAQLSTEFEAFRHDVYTTLGKGRKSDRSKQSIFQ